jgi:hypothetical protein
VPAAFNPIWNLGYVVTRGFEIYTLQDELPRDPQGVIVGQLDICRIVVMIEAQKEGIT